MLIDDNFTLSSGTSVSTVNNTESAGVGTYTTVQGSPLTSMSITTVSGFGDGNVLRLANGAQTYFRPFDAGSTLTLNALGVNQTLRVSFDIRFDGGFGGADNFSFGFVNVSTPNSILYANLDLSAVGGLASEFRYRTASFNMSDNIASTIVGGGWTEPATVSTAAYTMQLDVTKQDGGGFLLDYYRDGSIVGTSSQSVSSAFAVNAGGLAISGVAFRHSNLPGVTTYIDNVNASYVSSVPEPSTGAALLSAGIVVLWVSRRKLIGKGET